MCILLRLWLSLAIVVEFGYAAKYLDWCEYWRGLRRDHLRPECNGVYRVTFARRRSGRGDSLPELRGEFLSGFHRYKAEVTGMSSLTKRVLGIDECSVNYSFCRSSNICESGSICVGPTGYCCAPAQQFPATCPHPSQLAVSCTVANPVNWCSTNSQCGASRLCCPTRCGYNICL